MSRWQPLLETGLWTGRELQAAWDSMSREARQMSEYLDEDTFSGPLSVPVEGAGEGSSDGSTRMAVVMQLESLRLQTLVQSLTEYPDRKARPVWSWPNRDKMTTAWLLSLPGPHSGLSTPIFREGLAMVLSLPSPSCRDRVGEKIGSSRVDEFGDNVKCEPLAGNGWKVRHDRPKMELMRMMGWCGMVVTCEVWGLFQHLVPQQALSRAEVGQQRQVMVPDFRVQLSSQRGHTETRLAELKFT